MLINRNNTLIKNIKKGITSSLLKSYAVYTISSFFNASIPFLLLPILTENLSHSDFGVMSMFTIVIGFVTPFVSLSMEGAIARRYYSDEKDITSYIGNCLIVSLVCASIVFIVLSLLKSWLVAYTGLQLRWILLAVVSCLFQFNVTILLTMFQIKIKPLYYGIVQVTQSLLNFGLSYLLIQFYLMTWEGRIIGQVASCVLIGITSFLILSLCQKVKWKINMEYMKHAIKFGGGLLPHTLGAFLIMYVNRIFLTNMVGLNETGLYSAASQVVSIIGFFTLSFNNAYVPWLYSKLNSSNFEVKARIVKITYIYFGSILVAGILFYIFSPVIFALLIDYKFANATKYVFWIVLGLVFQGMYYMVTNYISYAEKTYLQSLVTVFVGLINIPLSYLFIYCFGPIGAGMAFSLSYLMMFLFTWLLSHKVYEMPW